MKRRTLLQVILATVLAPFLPKVDEEPDLMTGFTGDLNDANPFDNGQSVSIWANGNRYKKGETIICSYNYETHKFNINGVEYDQIEVPKGRTLEIHPEDLQI